MVDHLVLRKSNSDLKESDVELRKQIEALKCLIRDGRAKFQQKK